MDLTEGTGGDQWVSSIAVNAGERFLIYIDKKEMGDCSGVEKFAKELCHLKDISFFPISRSLHYEDHKGELKP